MCASGTFAVRQERVPRCAARFERWFGSVAAPAQPSAGLLRLPVTARALDASKRIEVRQPVRVEDHLRRLLRLLEQLPSLHAFHPNSIYYSTQPLGEPDPCWQLVMQQPQIVQRTLLDRSEPHVIAARRDLAFAASADEVARAVFLRTEIRTSALNALLRAGLGWIV